MGQSLPKPGLRPFLPADLPLLAEIFKSSIEELTAEDYSEPQQDAWMAQADNEGFAETLAKSLTLVATVEGSPIGFIALKDNELIEHLYDQDFDRDSNTIEVFVGRLRRKIGLDLIETVRGLGYRIRDEAPGV